MIYNESDNDVSKLTNSFEKWQRLIMQITVDVSDEMMKQLEPLRDELPQILVLGLQQMQANPTEGFSGLKDILEFLAQLPSPQEILALRLSDKLQAEVERLLEKNREEGLTSGEQHLWQQYEFVEHLVRMAKARALVKIKEAASA
jgi:hypothetical protein